MPSRLSLPNGFLFVPFDADPDHPLNYRIGKRCVERKLDRARRCLIAPQLVGAIGDRLLSREKAHVAFESGVTAQYPFVSERRDLIADALFGVGNDGLHHCADTLKQRPMPVGLGREIFVDFVHSEHRNTTKVLSPESKSTRPPDRRTTSISTGNRNGAGNIGRTMRE